VRSDRSVVAVCAGQICQGGFGGRQSSSARNSCGLAPHKRRAYAAHQNALETFPFFAVAVIVALTMGAPFYVVNLLAVLYVVLRIAHALLYILDKPMARSLMFAAAMMVNVVIFVLPAFR
jgi:uncharacterized MAPEG superfamily protein